MDDGLVHRMPYRKWLSDSGRQWPSKDEFEVGCTLEHAGYYVTWLTAFFGPALSVSAFSTALYPDKETDVPLDRIAPDLSVACIRFASGVVARLSCSIVARRDQTLQLFGDRGILQVDTSWDYRAPVRLKRYLNVRRRMVILPDGKYPLPSLPRQQKPRRNANPMEFCRGPAEVAAAIRRGAARTCRGLLPAQQRDRAGDPSRAGELRHLPALDHFRPGRADALGAISVPRHRPGTSTGDAQAYSL